jgi:hypothetical protein
MSAWRVARVRVCVCVCVCVCACVCVCVHVGDRVEVTQSHTRVFSLNSHQPPTLPTDATHPHRAPALTCRYVGMMKGGSYTLALMVGESLAGVFVSFNRIVTKAAYDDTPTAIEQSTFAFLYITLVYVAPLPFINATDSVLLCSILL